MQFNVVERRVVAASLIGLKAHSEATHGSASRAPAQRQRVAKKQCNSVEEIATNWTGSHSRREGEQCERDGYQLYTGNARSPRECCDNMCRPRLSKHDAYVLQPAHRDITLPCAAYQKRGVSADKAHVRKTQV